MSESYRLVKTKWDDIEYHQKSINGQQTCKQIQPFLKNVEAYFYIPIGNINDNRCDTSLINFFFTVEAGQLNITNIFVRRKKNNHESHFFDVNNKCYTNELQPKLLCHQDVPGWSFRTVKIADESIKTDLQKNTLSINDQRLTYLTTTLNESSRELTLTFSAQSGGSLIMQLYRKYLKH